ncbi:sigma-70 family RNA polymerase sigma factor [Gaoshiqia sp. Z1-71]|uniref:sigma-70 family RNA polymerase sigma factor n=1 Tax=Gaoshiqia hydrogeniformans TaxID=3290090 RepID=UPI003BF7A936
MANNIKPTSDKAYDHFFTENYQRALLFCVRIVNDHIAAEDIVQEVFITLWEKRDSFTFDEKLLHYVRRAVRNKSLNYLRDHSKFVELDNYQFPDDEYYDTEHDELLIRLSAQIQQLPPQCLKTFQLVALKGCTYAQAAEQLKISKNTVKSQMGKAFSLLRKKRW